MILEITLIILALIATLGLIGVFKGKHEKKWICGCYILLAVLVPEIYQRLQ